MTDRPLSIYFAGELFSLKHLAGNAILADEIESRSGGRYHCVVPQDLEQRETTPLQIRNQDLKCVARCDVGIFHFDGPELDSGTVVEYMVAKMLDIPSVIIRSDFRAGGDSSDPWNLMVSGYPRTEVALLDAMHLYQRSSATLGGTRTASALQAHCEVADMLVRALDKVVSAPPILPREEQRAVYQWLRRFPGAGLEETLSENEVHEILESKRSRGLL